MTWDIVLEPSKKKSNLGGREEVLKLLSEILPTLDLADPCWGQIDEESLVIDFNIGSEDPLSSIMLHVHAVGGNFDKILETIEHICKETSWRAFDLSSGEYLA